MIKWITTERKSISDKRYDYLSEVTGFDYVLEEYDGRDFTEFITKTGGDVQRYRVYGDNTDNFIITEK